VGGDSSSGAALALFDQGCAAQARGDLVVAVEKLREAVALGPTAPALAALGESLAGLSRHAEAVVHLAAAVGLGGGRPGHEA
jgi:Flp pilus assembly protein TadD